MLPTYFKNVCSGVNMAALVLQLSLQAASEYGIMLVDSN
jgi:hypothetical protein